MPKEPERGTKSVGAGLAPLRAYSDYRRYLRDFYADRKSRRDGFSFRAFARAAGFASPNFIQLVMDGKKNLTAESAAGVAAAMGLAGEEAVTFLELVRFGQAKDVGERARALEEMETRRRREAPGLLSDEDAAYLAHWYLPVIRELAALPDFSEDPAWVARRLGFPVPPKAIREALAFLERKGYLRRAGKARKRSGKGRLAPRDATLATGGMPAGDLARSARAFHLQMAELARQAIFTLPPERRSVTNTTLSLSPRGYARALERIEALRKDLLDLAAREAAPEQLFQLNVNLFPLTRMESP
jgi:uncharacterized protein (TIGR02147 family)